MIWKCIGVDVQRRRDVVGSGSGYRCRGGCTVVKSWVKVVNSYAGVLFDMVRRAMVATVGSESY